MKTRIKSYIDELRLNADEQLEFNQLVNAQNMKIFNTTMYYMLSINIILVVLFFINLIAGTQINLLWSKGVIISHTVLFILFSGTGLSFYLSKKKNNPSNANYSLRIQTLYILSSIIAVFISLNDQLVTTSITPYFIAGVGLPIIFNVKPSFAIFTFSLTFILLVILLPFVQFNSEVILSNYANGFVIYLISCYLAYRSWRTNLQNFRKDRIINVQRLKLESQNVELTKTAEDLNEAIATKNKFFSIISHDLKSPLSGFIGLTQLMSEDILQFSPQEITENSKAMNVSANNLLKLLINLLDWSKIQEKKIIFTPELVDVNIILVNTIENLKFIIKQNEMNIKINIPADFKIFADEQMLMTIFRNLISNSCKFSASNSIIEIGLFDNHINLSKSEICFYVTDKGIGMNEEILSSLFKFDTNNNRIGINNEPSSGIGLILCKDFVEFHKGKIWAESQEGIGTTIYFTVQTNIQESLTA